MSSPDSPKPSPIEKFLGSHPRAKQLAETPKPARESFATESYYDVDALRFTNGKRKSRYGRFRIVPVAAVKYLDATITATRPPNYLFDERMERIKRGPVQFRLVAV